MEKHDYESLEMEVVVFDTDDVMAVSGYDTTPVTLPFIEL